MDKSNEQPSGYSTGQWHALIGLDICRGNACGVGWEGYKQGYLAIKPEAKDMTDSKTGK